MWLSLALPLLAGLSVFFFGMKMMELALNQLAGPRIYRFLETATRTPAHGLVTGTALTALLQSSSAVTVISIGLVNAGVLTFPRTLGIILGTNIGTCLTTELIGLNLGAAALPLLLASSAVWLASWLPGPARGRAGAAVGGGNASGGAKTGRAGTPAPVQRSGGRAGERPAGSAHAGGPAAGSRPAPDRARPAVRTQAHGPSPAQEVVRPAAPQAGAQGPAQEPPAASGWLHAVRYAALAAAGFALVLIGIRIMQSIGPALQHLGLFAWFIEQAKVSLLWGVIAGAAVAALIHSSSAVIAMAMGFAAGGVISPELGIALTLGSNIGTCVTAWLASVGGTRAGVFVAWSHILLNVGGTVLFFPLIGLLHEVSSWMTADPSAQIARAQTLFNVASSLIALPFCYLPISRKKNLQPRT
ncbi:Na/Pi cotransporter family protein [Paenibacillus sp. UNC499MF]|uniref:Na/Pi cotransporter family protein n=1 Tax=Paenibacillus sp. UNC499MF TaxID=1502751 RepID=UPI0008A001FB|nr:Na/Pi symporter [Paenibacillus sp. UNC499MF]SEF49058.1 Na+/Pi-cotransporter [Paenibacillus sp. UNC499MF]